MMEGCCKLAVLEDVATFGVHVGAGALRSLSALMSNISPALTQRQMDELLVW